jgi:hypothetical protein
MTLSGEDIGPLAVAFAVEVGLTLLFLFRSGTLPNHPGLAELQKLVSRGRDQVFDTVWVALGGDEARGAVRRVLSRFTKFEGKSTLVVVPVYSKDPAIQLLHQLMHVLIHVELAKFVYTGEYLRPIFGLGWTKSHRADALNHGAVRVYRMSAADYLALILDAMQGTGHDQVSTTTGDETRSRGLVRIGRAIRELLGDWPEDVLWSPDVPDDDVSKAQNIPLPFVDQCRPNYRQMASVMTKAEEDDSVARRCAARRTFRSARWASIPTSSCRGFAILRCATSGSCLFANV